MRLSVPHICSTLCLSALWPRKSDARHVPVTTHTHIHIQSRDAGARALGYIIEITLERFYRRNLHLGGWGITQLIMMMTPTLRGGGGDDVTTSTSTASRRHWFLGGINSSLMNRRLIAASKSARCNYTWCSDSVDDVNHQFSRDNYVQFSTNQHTPSTYRISYLIVASSALSSPNTERWPLAQHINKAERSYRPNAETSSETDYSWS